MVMQAFVLLPSAISELFSQVTQSGKLTRADRYGLMAAVMSEGLDEEERTAIDRLLYAISRGRVQLVDEVSALA